MHERISIEIALRFKIVRTTLVLSQSEFGKKLGIAQNYVSAIEKANRNVTARIISKLEKEFNINPNWILGNSNEMYLSLVDKMHLTTAELREFLKSYEALSKAQQEAVNSLVREFNRK